MNISGIVKKEGIKNLKHEAKMLFRETLGTSFRSRDVSFNQSRLRSMVENGLIFVVSQEEEEREIPLKRYQSGERFLLDLDTNEKVYNFQEIKDSANYKAIIKDTKTIKGAYNIYRASHRSYAHFEEDLRNSVLEVLNSYNLI